MKNAYMMSVDEVVQRGRSVLPPTRKRTNGRIRVHGVPRGGALALHYLIASGLDHLLPVLRPEDADVILDDIVDSGHTRAKYAKLHPGVPFVALVNTKKKTADKMLGWVVFPWETTKVDDAQDTVTRLLEHIGEDPTREGLLETPARIVKSWGTLFGGYQQKAEDHLRVFKDGACDEMVVLRDVEFFSTCEHHMLPFSGRAHIAYVPNKRVIGVSKLARILDVFARRMQIQERIGQQVTEALMTGLMPLGAACVLEAQHFCMTARGVQKQNSVMVTSSLRGCFKKEADCRAEFYKLIGK